MFNQNDDVYFLFDNNIVYGYISAILLHKDNNFGRKYLVRLYESLIVNGSVFTILSVPESELYLTIDELKERLSA